MTPDQQVQLLERILEGAWGDLHYFRRGGAERPSTSLVSELLRLFAEVKEHGRDLGTELMRGGSLSAKDGDLLRVWDSYIERCASLRATDVAGAMTWLAVEDPHIVPDGTMVLLDTLPPEPPPVEARFLEWLCSRAERAVARRVRCPGMSKVFPDEEPAYSLPSDEQDFADMLCARLFRPPLPVEPDERPDLSASVTALEAPEREGEVEAVASRIRALIDSGAALDDITVIFPEPRLYMPLVESVFPRYGIPATPGTGLPLGTAGPARVALALLDAVTSNLGRDEVMRLLRSPYVSFSDEGLDLDTRYVLRIARLSVFPGGRDSWQGLFESRARQHEKRAADESIDEVTRSRASDEARRARDQCSVLLRLFDRLDRISTSLTTAAFTLELRSAMRDLGILGSIASKDRLCEVDARAVKAIWRVLDELVSASSLLGDTERGIDRHRDAFQLLVAGRRYMPRMPRRDVVQVMDIGAALATENEHVFLCGLVEKDFPSAGSPCVVPDAAGAAAGLFERGHEVRRQRYLFLNAVTSARSCLFLARPTTLGENPAVASGLLDEVMRQFVLNRPSTPPRAPTWRSVQLEVGAALTSKEPAPEALLLALEPELRSHAVRAAMVENLLRGPGVISPYNGTVVDPALAGSIGSRYADHAWTPTELEAYATCPFSFLARHVWRLREDEEPTAEMSGQELGTLVHDVLARFGTGLREDGVDIAAGDFDGLIGRMRTTVKDAVAVSGGPGVVWDLVSDGLCATGRRCGLLARLLETEVEQPLPGFEPRFLELALGSPRGVNDPRSLDEPVSVTLPRGDGSTMTLRLTGKVDRIDVDPNCGEGIIIDYKTGSRTVEPRDMSSGRSVQLTLYPLMVEAAVRQGLLDGGPSKVVASGIYHVSPRAPITRRLLGTKEAKKALKDAGAKFYRNTLDKAIPVTVTHILSAVDGTKAGRFPPSDAPESSDCVYCAARHLCRSPSAEVARPW